MRHEGVERLAFGPDCGLSLEHRLDVTVVAEAEGRVTEKLVDPTVTERNASKQHVNPIRLSCHPPVSHCSEKGPSQSNHSFREKCSEVLDAVCSFLSSEELTLVEPRTTVAQSARSAESQEVAIQKSDEVGKWASVLHKDVSKFMKERKPRLKLNQGVILIKHKFQSGMKNFTKSIILNAKFRRKLDIFAWIGQAQEQYHHASISREPMAWSHVKYLSSNSMAVIRQ